MPSIVSKSSLAKRLSDDGGDAGGDASGDAGGTTHLYLNVYDITPVNNYLYCFGLGIFHSGIEGAPSFDFMKFSSRGISFCQRESIKMMLVSVEVNNVIVINLHFIFIQQFLVSFFFFSFYSRS